MAIENNNGQNPNKKTLKVSRKVVFITTFILSIIISITSSVLMVTELAIPKRIDLYTRYDDTHKQTEENYSKYLHFDVVYSNPTYIEPTDSYYITATIIVSPQNEKYTFKNCTVTLYIKNIKWNRLKSVELQISEEGKAVGTITNTIQRILTPIINSSTSDLCVEKISGFVYV